MRNFTPFCIGKVKSFLVVFLLLSSSLSYSQSILGFQDTTINNGGADLQVGTQYRFVNERDTGAILSESNPIISFDFDSPSKSELNKTSFSFLNPFSSGTISGPSLNINPSNVSCNERLPLVNGLSFENVNASITENVPELLCLGAVSAVSNLTDSDLNNFATINMTGLGCEAELSVADLDNEIYPAGSFAGFRVSSEGLLQVSVAATIDISTYLNGTRQETFNAVSSTLGVSTDLLNADGTVTLGFITNTDFDELRISYDPLVSVLFSAQVYHAVVQSFCAGTELECNEKTVLSNPSFPFYINPSLTGVNGLLCALCSVTDTDNLLTEDDDDFATINLAVGVASSGSIAVKSDVDTFPAGTFAGFDIANSGLLDLNLLNGIVVNTYLDNSIQESQTGSGGLVSINTSLLNSDGRRVVGFATSLPFDEVQIVASNTLSVNLGSTRVFGAAVQKFCEAPELVCNKDTGFTNTNFPVIINSQNTGLAGVACVSCDISDAENVISGSDTDFATIQLAVGVLSSGSIAVEDVLSSYQPNTFVGFEIENASLLNLDVLDNIAIETYLDGVLQETQTGVSALIGVNTSLISGQGGRRTLGFVASQEFDQVRLTLTNTVNLNLGTTRVYQAVIKKLCSGNILCDQTNFLNEGEFGFPVVINSFETGIDGLACVGCTVENANNAISSDLNDFAEIQISAGVLSTGTIAVLDPIDTFPEGSVAGFTIQDLQSLVQLDLFENLQICTYLNGVEQECSTVGNLINLTAVVDIFGGSSGLVNVGFETSLEYNEIRFTAGSLVSVNLLDTSIRVFGAFVDTRTATGNGPNALNCDPNAVDDTVTVATVSNSIIDVLINDSFGGDGPSFSAITVVNQPLNGTASVDDNGTPNDPTDDTIIFTPGVNFTGSDMFTYEICDSSGDCDRATVILTVRPDELTVTKIGVYDPVDESIIYTYNVLNSGTVQINDITIDETLFTGTNTISPVVLQGMIQDLDGDGDATDLAPGDSAIFSVVYSVSQDDLLVGNVSNQANGSGFNPSGNLVLDLSDDPSTSAVDDPTIVLLVSLPQIDLVKSGVYVDVNSDGIVNIGDRIDYTFNATNTGNT
ncbi:MAG: Ig-like domain-containing protein, partial [Nonlabens sp.]|uniref:Ig-like domain-containing protein n=1 Tax=Nonlabens sp. TaxID=1888209 RepID=UPI003218F12F